MAPLAAEGCTKSGARVSQLGAWYMHVPSLTAGSQRQIYYELVHCQTDSIAPSVAEVFEKRCQHKGCRPAGRRETGDAGKKCIQEQKRSPKLFTTKRWLKMSSITN